MAPEFFPILAFVGLAILVLFGFIGGTVSLRAGWYSSRNRHTWRKRAAVMFGGTLVAAVMLLFLGQKIHQQCFLNEPFVAACANGNMEQVEELPQKGASPDAYGIDFSETALIAATKNGHIEVVDLLLSHGTNVKLRNSRGKTALQCARELDSKEIAATLEPYESE